MFEGTKNRRNEEKKGGKKERRKGRKKWGAQEEKEGRNGRERRKPNTSAREKCE